MPVKGPALTVSSASVVQSSSTRHSPSLKISFQFSAFIFSIAGHPLSDSVCGNKRVINMLIVVTWVAISEYSIAILMACFKQ